jgi:hypothetical protein
LEFKIVDADLRNLPQIRRSNTNPLLKALLDGDTVFIEDVDGKTQGRLTKYYETASRHKKAFRYSKQIVDGKIGYICWFIDKS